MKPKFIVRETQDGGFAVFRFNAQNGSFDQFSPKTGSVSKEDAEKECVECNYLAEEETPGLINTDKKTKNNKRTARKKLSFFIILAILVVVPTVFFLNKPDSFLDEEGSCVVPKEYSWIYGGWEADDGFQLLITKKGLRKVFDKNSEDIRLVEPLEFTFNILNNVPQLCYQDPEFDYSMEIILDGFRDEFKRVQISPMSKKEIAENLKQLECHPVQGSWQFKNTKFTIIKDRRVDYETKEGDEKVTLLKNGNLRIGNSEFEYDATRDVLITGYSNTDDYVTITYKRIK